MSNQKKSLYDSSLSGQNSYSDTVPLYKDKSQKYSAKNLQEYKDYLNENFKVVVRIRPPLPREITGDQFITTVPPTPPPPHPLYNILTRFKSVLIINKYVYMNIFLIKSNQIV